MQVFSHTCTFNLDAKSESLPAPKSDELPQMGSRRSRPDTTYILRTYKTHNRGGAGEAQATRVRNAQHVRRAINRHPPSDRFYIENWCRRGLLAPASTV